MSYRKRHNTGYLIGAILSVVALLVLLTPSSQVYLRNGPMLPGHEDLECFSCHKDEHGSFRQQVQTNLQYLLKNREDFVSVGLRSVENTECLKCHERPNDKHPVYRFREPKYQKIREKIKANLCVTCHLEHNNNRLSVKPTFCTHCHDELKLNDDQIDVSHEELVKQNKWESCLTCHDFHGNHEMKLKTKVSSGIKIKEIEAYFRRGENPYPSDVTHKAKKHAE